MEKTNQNASAWMAAGEKKGIDVSYLHQDKTKIFDFLEQLGLPRPASHLVEGIYAQWPIIDDLFKLFPSYFCRLIPKEGERQYKPLVRSAQEFREFCSPHNMKKYIINLVEKGNVTHTGSIIAADETPSDIRKCIVEVVEGDGPDLFHGHMTPVHAEVNFNRAICYDGKIPTEEESGLVFTALRLVGGPRHPFPGYYEFEVWDRKDIIFRNYQGPGTAYSNIKMPDPILPSHPGD